jgi:hypothetical protein
MLTIMRRISSFTIACTRKPDEFDWGAYTTREHHRFMKTSRVSRELDET